jgi:hypothetical protein
VPVREPHSIAVLLDHKKVPNINRVTTKTVQPTQLKLLINSTGLNLACPSPSSATSSLTLPPLATTTVLLLFNPLYFGVLHGVGSTSPNTSAPSPVSPNLGVLILQLYNDEFEGYKGDTMVVVVEVLWWMGGVWRTSGKEV